MREVVPIGQDETVIIIVHQITLQYIPINKLPINKLFGQAYNSKRILGRGPSGEEELDSADWKGERGRLARRWRARRPRRTRLRGVRKMFSIFYLFSGACWGCFECVLGVF